jgi:hypothetical protein
LNQWILFHWLILPSQKALVKAIAERGWNPLDYNILTKLPACHVINLADNEEQNKSTGPGICMIPPLLKLIFLNGTRSYYLDKLIKEEKKD